MGKLKKRGDGRYRLSIYLGKDPSTGKNRYKYVYGDSQKEAEEKALNVRLSMRKGLDVLAEQETFDVWAHRWRTVKAAEVSRGRMVTYASNIKKLEPLFFMTISRIKTSDIQSIILDLAFADPPLAKKHCWESKAQFNKYFHSPWKIG